VANTTAMFQNLALIGALAERHLVDPAKVADWAEFFAREWKMARGRHCQSGTSAESSGPAARLCQAAREEREAPESLE